MKFTMMIDFDVKKINYANKLLFFSTQFGKSLSSLFRFFQNVLLLSPKVCSAHLPFSSFLPSALEHSFESVD